MAEDLFKQQQTRLWQLLTCVLFQRLVSGLTVPRNFNQAYVFSNMLKCSILYFCKNPSIVSLIFIIFFFFFSLGSCKTLFELRSYQFESNNIAYKSHVRHRCGDVYRNTNPEVGHKMLVLLVHFHLILPSTQSYSLQNLNYFLYVSQSQDYDHFLECPSRKADRTPTE